MPNSQEVGTSTVRRAAVCAGGMCPAEMLLCCSRVVRWGWRVAARLGVVGETLGPTAPGAELFHAPLTAWQSLCYL